jgi:hydrogenase maturation protein HypF
MRRRVRVRGLVQGVGFRPWIHGLATKLELSGRVCNDEEGVLIEVQGRRWALFLEELARNPPPLARIDSVEAQAISPLPDERNFTIDASSHGGRVTVAIGPDAGVCDECLAELFDPLQRRYRYAFLNCTHCGPRFTITRGLPYDRPQTSMAPFEMCRECAREYGDSADRRFHAQPIACPVCGPKLSHPIEEIAERLRRKEIVALKGLGGYVLACDARDEATVTRLRRRKQRDGKPFAVMVANVASARRLAELGAEELALLTSTRRPIVVARRRGDGLAPDIAPHLAWLGIMLPSTPLHYLLFHELAGRPEDIGWLQEPQPTALVMTSANPGGEPLIIDDGEARTRLSAIADLVVTHDRAILVRVDDSVARVVAGAGTFVRRARGWVPQPVRLACEVPQVVAFGAFLKDTLCLTRGNQAFLSQHLGDLDDPATFAFLEETLEHLTRTLDVRPVAVAHDLHPDFLSTRKALALGLPAFAVQHHHAHVAAVMAEHRRLAPTVGLALDGFGLGADGGCWGGELLRVDGSGFTRLGHLRELRQPGGDIAARQPWRMAAAALHALGRVDEISVRLGRHGASRTFIELLDRGLHAPPTSSCGRLFDAACGLLEVCPNATFEGEAPMRLESLVRRPEVLPGTWRIEKGVLDVLPLLDALIGRPAANGADIFHGTLAAALVDWAVPAARADGAIVALGGGCILNRTLTELLVEGFTRQGIAVLLPREAPANDGGLSLGQAWVAAQLLQR